MLIFSPLAVTIVTEVLHTLRVDRSTFYSIDIHFYQNRTEQNALFPIIGLISRTIRHEDVIEKGANRRLCLVLALRTRRAQVLTTPYNL